MIAVDGVFSMEGNIADVPNLVRLGQRYGAALVIDDAHALGVMGPRGDGTAAHFGLNDEVAEGMVEQTGDERFVYDLYRRLVQMFGAVVLGVPD